MYTCMNRCCQIKIERYTPLISKYYPHKNYKEKAGVLFFDKNKNKILLVQSRGNLWGIPKGTFEDGETSKQCAVREVKEETGFNISPIELKNNYVKVKGRAYYYYVEMDETDVEVQKDYEDNDANGISWLNCNCLIKLMKNGKMRVNQHTRIVLRHFLNLTLPTC